MGKRVFEPIVVNGMELKNRIGFAPMLNMPDVMMTGQITDNTVEWFAARARGGAGFIMTGALAPPLLALPGIKEGLARIAEACHAHGCKVAVQTVMGGPLGGFNALTSGNLGEIAKEATEWVTVCLEAVRAAPDNPYGDDNEVIAAAILKEMGDLR